ncbi:MAG: DUF559 domain-containing protein [Pseudomonadota bacterium]
MADNTQGCASDRIRDAWREERGYRLLRFWNPQVLTESMAVLEKILASFPPLPRLSPSGGRGVTAHLSPSRCPCLRRSPPL